MFSYFNIPTEFLHVTILLTKNNSQQARPIFAKLSSNKKAKTVFDFKGCPIFWDNLTRPETTRFLDVKVMQGGCPVKKHRALFN
jgi:hypothetical protein